MEFRYFGPPLSLSPAQPASSLRLEHLLKPLPSQGKAVSTVEPLGSAINQQILPFARYSGTPASRCGVPCTERLALTGGLKAAVHDPARITLERVSGGQINEVYRVRMPGDLSLLYKWHAEPPEGFFEAEVGGLAAIAATDSLRVPRVLAFSDQGLLMEWLEPPPRGAAFDVSAQGEALGRGLAKLHRVSREAFGFEHDNFVGLLPQQNRWSTRWSEFYRDRRLVPQLEIAACRGRLNARRRRLAERLLEALPGLIDDGAVRPSLVHGDLWGGNWLATAQGPALIDPAVYFSNREMDLAMASLFGGFPDSFFQSYHEAFPLPPGHAERLPLYQLYYLLIHLNVFGEAYGPAVDRILLRYSG